MTDFATLTFERHLPCPPDRLRHLLTDRAARERWGAPSADTVIVIDSYDLRPGGQERARCGPADAPDFHTLTDFHVLEPRRLVSTETLYVEGAAQAVSLITQVIAGREDAAHLTVTLQVVGLTGAEMVEGYREGWTGALDALARLVEEVPA